MGDFFTPWNTTREDNPTSLLETQCLDNPAKGYHLCELKQYEYKSVYTKVALFVNSNALKDSMEVL